MRGVEVWCKGCSGVVKIWCEGCDGVVEIWCDGVAEMEGWRVVW